MSTERAIDFVAANFLSSLVSLYGGDCWDSYPDLGENDWERVLDRAAEIADDPGVAAFNAAYAVLKARADTHA